MKVVQAVGWFHPDSMGGTETYVQALSSRLRDGGHDVLVAAPSAGGSGPRTYEADGTSVFRYPIPACPTRAEAQGRTRASGAEFLHEWLACIRPDIVHVHTFVTGLGLDEVVAARRAGARVIVTTHSSALGFICQRGTLMWRGETICDGHLDIARCSACELEHRGLDGAFGSAISHTPLEISRVARHIPGRLGTALGMPELIAWNRERQTRMLSLVECFVVLTARAAAIVVDNGAPPGKIIVNRLGVSQRFARRQQARTPGTPIKVAYVGRFDPIKGVLDLAAAMRQLPADVPLRCEFRGPSNTPADRATRSEIKRLCAGDPRVTVEDAVSTDSIPALMESYDLVCCPSRCLEGGPTVGLEAMAAGTPVIAATVGGVAELLEDGVNGRLVPPGDVDALASALAEVARHPDAIDRWRAGLPRPRTMDDVAADYLRLYASRS